MKQTFSAWLLLLLPALSIAQTASLPLSKRIVPTTEQKGAFQYQPAAGDRLVYEVKSPDGTRYNFTVTLKRYETDPDKNHPFPIAFDWTMGAPHNSSGSVEICGSCYTDATRYQNYFTSGSRLQLSNASTVFMSGLNYFEPEQNDEKKTVMVMDGKEISFYDRLGYETQPVKVGKKTVQLLMKKYNSSPTLDGENSVYVQVGYDRLILGMELGFHIQLKEILPAKK
ncbi:MAG TPA: hypothetical protein PKE63_01100 [Lacibacter sp.]|nr:hypothetical protein [Lacibacter sp.]HMO90153.1 hypothetical protein [Lacibacter sp.]HMP85838.1 hypothetical protein [Lacibacter sp.]